MGLKDDATKAVLNEVVGGLRARRARRERFRDELLALMTEYATLIETVRIRYLDTLKLLENPGSFGQPDPVIMNHPERDSIKPRRLRDDLVVGSVVWPYWGEDQDLDAVAQQLEIETNSKTEGGIAPSAVSALGKLRKVRETRHFGGSVRTQAVDDLRMSALQTARQAMGELDAAWAAIRPRLDDAFGLVAVEYLRVVRHELRDYALEVDNTIRMAFADGPDAKPESLDAARRIVEDFVMRADLWSGAITVARSQIRAGRPL